MDLDERRRHGELLQRRIQRLAAAAEVAFGLSLGAAASAGDTRVQIGPHAGNFDDVRELAELNDCQSLKWSPSVTEDGLTIVFQAGGSGDIYIAERRGRTDEAGEPTAFDPPQPLDELNRASSDNNPNISPDGLEIVFASRRDGSSDLYVARRADRSARFGEPESLGAPINTPELVESDGQFSRDGRSLYFMRGEQGPRWGVDTAIFVAMRPDAGVDWDDDSVPVSRVEGTDIVSGEGSPSLSSDGETLFWSEWFPLDPQDPPGDIWFARRVDGALDTFADARMLPYPVNTVGAEITPWIGYDWPAPGSKLWFVRELPGCGFSIFEATWYPADDGIGPFRRGDCNDDGAVDISDGICALEWLFLAGAAPDCLAVLNADGDDGLNITDPTYLFNHLFLGSPSLPAPFPDCGGSESEADARLGCEQSACP